MVITDAELEIARLFYEKTEIKLNYLISYEYIGSNLFKFLKDHRDKIKSLYLDSATFSKNTGKSDTELDQYILYACYVTRYIIAIHVPFKRCRQHLTSERLLFGLGMQVSKVLRFIYMRILVKNLMLSQKLYLRLFGVGGFVHRINSLS